MKKVLAALIFAVVALIAFAQEKPAVKASRTSSPPRVDGILDDPCWVSAEPFSAFIQTYPNPGEKPAYGTEVKVIYDERTIYIGVNCLDPEPSKIDMRLIRRDRSEVTDKVQIQLDPYLTKKEAYAFQVCASSSLADFFTYNEFSTNMEWNGIWEARSSITPEGWSCEIAIPFSEMRIFHSSELPMGFQVIRRIARLGELDCLAYIPPGERKNVSGFGTIEGISNIKATKKADLFPFLVIKDRFHTREGFYKRGASFDAGLDFNYPLSSRFTLTGTVNPDFGQVEQDSTVLNLSAYETFFSENRPFFMEGFQNFNPPKAAFSSTTFLYTRRIGAPPWEPYSYEGHKVVRAPENTTILGALKVTGTTENRLNVAAFAAVTQAERGQYADSEGYLHDLLMRKQTLFSAWRLNQNFGTNSSVGLMQTYKNESGGRKALMSVLTTDLHSKENKHNFTLDIISTDIDDGDEKEYGTGLEAQYTAKVTKKWTATACYIAHPKDYEPNDMGYLRRNDEYKLVTAIEWENSEPTKRFNQATFGVYNWYGKNGDGLILTRGGEIDLWGEFPNRWTMWGGISSEFPYYDDREPRLDGFAIYRRTENAAWIGFGTDSRKPVTANLGFVTFKNQHGWGFHQDGTVQWRFSDKFMLSETYELTKHDGLFLYAGTDESGSHPVFADASTLQYDFTTRLSYIFNPKLTLDFYSQLFTANGSYSGFRKIFSATNSLPTTAPGDPDFHFGSNNITAVLRWEFKPASYLYVVFSHGQMGAIEYDGDDRRVGMSLRREMTLLTSAPRDDLFLVKFSYHF